MAIFKKRIDKLSYFFDTPYFAFILGSIELICYYLGLDLALIIVISLSISFVALFKEKLNCLLVIFLFMSSMISLKNSPTDMIFNENRDYYFQPSVYITCIIFAAIPVLILTGRAIKNIATKKIEFESLFIATIIFGITLLTNGLLTTGYNYSDLVYGLFMFFFFVILFIAVRPFTKIDKESLLKLSRQVAIYLLVPLIELLVFYIFYLPKINIEDVRIDILLGWGNRNTIGMLLVTLTPFLLYLLKNEKNGVLLVLTAILQFIVVIAVFSTFSRQSFVFLFVLVLIYLIYLVFISKKDSKKIWIITLGLLISSVVVLLYVGDSTGLFERLNINKPTSINHRFQLWHDALNEFERYPAFGGGFFFMGGDQVIQLTNIMPLSCHNTIFEIMGACGFFGIAAYLFYRFVWLTKVIKEFNKDRFYCLLSCLMIILMSLVDIHIFDFFGTAIYIMLFALSLSKVKKEKENAFNENYINDTKKEQLEKECY